MYSDKDKLSKVTATRPASQEMQNEILQSEGKGFPGRKEKDAGL